MNKITTAQVKAGNCKNLLPEFGRTEDVQRLFGIKRGSLYNLHKKRKVESSLLRIAGKTSGIRLWYLQGIREYLMAVMKEQEQNRSLEPSGQNTLTE